MILSKELSIENEAGFHVRVASMICKTAMKYRAKTLLAKGSYYADCKSCLDLLTLMAPKGEKLTLNVEGDDAQEALAAIEELFERKFYEDDFAGWEERSNGSQNAEKTPSLGNCAAS